jgi:hypothetical protein
MIQRRGIKRKRSLVITETVSTDCLRLIVTFLADPSSVWNLMCTNQQFSKICSEHRVKTFWIEWLFRQLSPTLGSEITRAFSRKDITLGRLSGGLSKQACEFCQAVRVEHLTFPLNILLCQDCIDIYTLPIEVFDSGSGLVVRSAMSDLPQTAVVRDNILCYQLLKVSPKPWVSEASTVVGVLRKYGFESLDDMHRKINAVLSATLNNLRPKLVKRYWPFLDPSLLPLVGPKMDELLWQSNCVEKALRTHDYHSDTLIAIVPNLDLEPTIEGQLFRHLRLAYYRFLDRQLPLIQNLSCICPFDSFDPYNETVSSLREKHRQYSTAEALFLGRQRKLPVNLRVHRKNQLGWTGDAKTSYACWIEQSKKFTLQFADAKVAEIVTRVLQQKSTLTWHRAIKKNSSEYLQVFKNACSKLPPHVKEVPRNVHVPSDMEKAVKKIYPTMQQKTAWTLTRDIYLASKKSLLYLAMTKKDFGTLVHSVREFRLEEHKALYPGTHIDPDTFLEDSKL